MHSTTMKKFIRLIHTDITKNMYIQSWKIMEIR